MSSIREELELAAFIREIDGNNKMGACRLAEKILDWQAARAHEGGEAVGVVDFSGVVQWFKPYKSPPAGTELYTHPSASVPDSAERVLASLGHYQTESARCRARYKEVVTHTQGPKNPPVFCVLGSGHDGPHRGQHGANMRENLIELGPAINVCAKCKVRWPCPDAEKAFKASTTPQPADDWGQKPNKPGRYAVRGFNSSGTEALVCVAYDDDQLVCNLHDSNSDPLHKFSNLMSEISDKFEWLELRPNPPEQGAE